MGETAEDACAGRRRRAGGRCGGCCEGRAAGGHDREDIIKLILHNVIQSM